MTVKRVKRGVLVNGVRRVVVKGERGEGIGRLDRMESIYVSEEGSGTLYEENCKRATIK